MLFTERNTSSCTRVLCIKRSVKYAIPPFATMRRLAKLLVACRSAIREIGQTNRRLRFDQELYCQVHPTRTAATRGKNDCCRDMTGRRRQMHRAVDAGAADTCHLRCTHAPDGSRCQILTTSRYKGLPRERTLVVECATGADLTWKRLLGGRLCVGIEVGYIAT